MAAKWPAVQVRKDLQGFFRLLTALHFCVAHPTAVAFQLSAETKEGCWSRFRKGFSRGTLKHVPNALRAIYSAASARNFARGSAGDWVAGCGPRYDTLKLRDYRPTSYLRYAYSEDQTTFPVSGPMAGGVSRKSLCCPADRDRSSLRQTGYGERFERARTTQRATARERSRGAEWTRRHAGVSRGPNRQDSCR